jgi:single-stranded DNA-binding protein
MNRVMLVGRLTRDPELRTLPSGKPVANFTGADSTNEHEHLSRRLPPTFLR